MNLYEMSTYKSCWRWSVSQFSTCMSFLRDGCRRHSFLNSQTDEPNAHFPWANELTICPDMNGSQIPVKTSFTGHRWRKTKDFFVFCSGKICLVLFHAFCSFVFMPSVSGTQGKCPNSHHSHPLHLFITRIYRECKVQNWLILKETLYLLVV